MENKKKGVLMVMSNANGWRNPKVFGGAEIKTTSIINKIEEIDWYVILPYQLYNVFANKFSASQLYYLPMKTLFSETNVVKDLLQGLVYTWKCVAVGWKNRTNFDLIYSSTTNFSDIFPAKIISLITGKPYIVKYHISIYNEPRTLRIYRNFREEKNSRLDSFIRAVLARITIIFLKQAKKNLVVCKYLGKQLEDCGIKKDKIELNYNGLDFKEMEKFRVNNVEKKFDICFIGRIEKNKGLLDLINVIKDLKNEKKDISAVIIGDGVFLKELKNKISAKKLENNISVKGFLGNERYLLLQQSNIFVSPTYAKEGFGLTLLEALFFNVPIIAYTHPVFEEVFDCFEAVKLIDQDKRLLESSILKMLEEKGSYPSDLDIYSLENCVKREKDILFKLI
jgi:glycosyltransferase involved in cell wall biosynthesis